VPQQVVFKIKTQYKILWHKLYNDTTKGQVWQGEKFKIQPESRNFKLFYSYSKQISPFPAKRKGEQMVTWRLGQIAMPSPNVFRSAMGRRDTSPMSTEEVDKAAGLASTAGVCYKEGNVG
jgi:hypothetical protein